MAESREQIMNDGFAIWSNAIPADACRTLAEEIEARLSEFDDHSIALRRSNGALYGARDVLKWLPAARQIWRTGSICDHLISLLGPECGLVRGLFFDKPPEGNWSLPWHQDLTIAVREHRPSERFRRPTFKAGIPHVEAPAELLREMLTLRIHLDDMNQDNGPLRVWPGTHHDVGPTPTDVSHVTHPVTIVCRAGDVLAMRPLLYHCSLSAMPVTSLHRRILHLEFAASPSLAMPMDWHEFWPVQGGSLCSPMTTLGENGEAFDGDHQRRKGLA